MIEIPTYPVCGGAYYKGKTAGMAGCIYSLLVFNDLSRAAVTATWIPEDAWRLLLATKMHVSAGTKIGAWRRELWRSTRTMQKRFERNRWIGWIVGRRRSWPEDQGMQPMQPAK